MRFSSCIVNLATKDKHFPEGQARLKESVRRSGFRGEFLYWPPVSFPKAFPHHQEVPFALSRTVSSGRVSARWTWPCGATPPVSCFGP